MTLPYDNFTLFVWKLVIEICIYIFHLSHFLFCTRSPLSLVPGKLKHIKHKFFKLHSIRRCRFCMLTILIDIRYFLFGDVMREIFEMVSK